MNTWRVRERVINISCKHNKKKINDKPENYILITLERTHKECDTQAISKTIHSTLKRKKRSKFLNSTIYLRINSGPV